MGLCISANKDPDSALKLGFSIEPKNEPVLIPSPVKDSVNAGDRTAGDASLNSQFSPARFVDADSKDESFFDSQPWLESDCEDDFVSVNGDFTPSRGNTPVHHNFSSGNPRASNARRAEVPVVSKPEQSPEKKKRLSELFSESVRDDNNADSKNEAPEKAVPEAIVNQQYSEATRSGELRDEDEQSKSGQCCFPRLILSRSFSERQKKMSPAQKAG